MGGRVVRRSLFAVALLGWSSAALSQDAVVHDVEGNRVTSTAATIGASWMPPLRTVNDGFHLSKSLLFPAPGGRSAAAKAVVRLGFKDIAMLGLRGLASPWGAVGVAYAAAQAVAMFEEYRIQHPSAQQGIEYLEHDAGTSTVPAQRVCYSGASTVLTPLWNGDVCAIDAADLGGRLAGLVPPVQATCSTNPTVYGTRTYVFKRTTSTTNGEIQALACGSLGATVSYSGSLRTVQVCPPLPDGTVPTPGIDGKCPTGTYAPITQPDALAFVATYPKAMTDEEYEAILDEVFDRLPSQAVNDLPEGELRVNVLDSPLAGPTTTAVSSDGSALSEVIEWNIGRLADDLPGSRRADTEANEWSETKTSTTTAADGTVTTTTTTTTATEAADTVDVCADGSSAAGCAALGSPPTDGVVPEARDVTWVAENLGLPAQCPAPLTFAVRSWSFAMNWTPACDIAPFIRAGVLAMTALAVAFFLVGTVNKS